MQDKRRRGAEGDQLDRAVEQAISAMLDGLPFEQRVLAMRSLSEKLGTLLSQAPTDGRDQVEELRNRAHLAAAFRAKFPGHEN